VIFAGASSADMFWIVSQYPAPITSGIYVYLIVVIHGSWPPGCGPLRRRYDSHQWSRWPCSSPGTVGAGNRLAQDAYFI